MLINCNKMNKKYIYFNRVLAYTSGHVDQECWHIPVDMLIKSVGLYQWTC